MSRKRAHTPPTNPTRFGIVAFSRKNIEAVCSHESCRILSIPPVAVEFISVYFVINFFIRRQSSAAAYPFIRCRKVFAAAGGKNLPTTKTPCELLTPRQAASSQGFKKK